MRLRRIEQSAKNEFHLALLDINLPDGTGLDLCDEIQLRRQQTYIIFLTANDRESDQLRGYEAGGSDYVTKLFSLAELCKKVAAVFEHLERHTCRGCAWRTLFRNKADISPLILA